MSLLQWYCRSSCESNRYNFGQFAHNMGLISKSIEDALDLQYLKCKEQESRGDYSGLHACNILDIILASTGACPGLAFAGDDDK